MTLMTGSILAPSGAAQENASYDIRIVAAVGSDGIGFVASSGGAVVGPITGQTGGDGTFAAECIATSLMDQANTVYRLVMTGNGVTAPPIYFTAPASGPARIFDNITPSPADLPLGTHGASLHTGDVLPDSSEQTLGNGSIMLGGRTLASAPTPPAGGRTLLVDTGSGTLMAKTSAGVGISLEGPVSGTLRAGATYQNYSRLGATITNGGVLALGTVFVFSFNLPEGAPCAGMKLVAGTTALVQGATTNHLWGVMLDSARVVKAVTPNLNTAGEPIWAAGTEKTFTWNTPFTTTYAGQHYFGVMFAATGGAPVAPSLFVVAGNATVNALAPIISGNSSTGQTTPPALGTTLGAITAQGGEPWCTLV